MNSLENLLPAPKHTFNNKGLQEEEEYFKITNINGNSKKSNQNEPKIEIKKVIPPFGKRKGYQIKGIEDFGDGGAFPEIHQPQYPLNMGKKGDSSSSNSSSGSKSLIPIQTDSTGRVKHEMILGGGKSLVALNNTQYTDLLPKNFTESDLQRPDEEELQETAERTKSALEKIINGKIKMNKTGANIENASNKQISYVNYTSSNGADGQRVIRMVELQQDPLEPPRHRIKKKILTPGSPPPTVMHSPPRKLTVQEKQDWNIPPCISNWQNTKGFAISLDKRLSADGRGLQQVEINDKFAQLSQALYISESQAREEVAARAELEKQRLQKEKEKKQEALRKLAEDVRNERSGRPPANVINNNSSSNNNNNNNEEQRKRYRDSDSSSSDSSSDDSSSDSSSDNSDVENENDKEKRDRIRFEKKRERERKYRLEISKKSKYTRDQDRDVSEKIALGGGGAGGARRTEDSIYDQRLFNQSESLGSGFGDDEAYNVYSKPLFGGNVSNSIYRPRVNKSDDFESVDDILSNKRFNSSNGGSGNNSSKKDDPFGMDEFLSSAKHKK